MTRAPCAETPPAGRLTVTSPASTADGRILTLDGLRGCAVLLVLVHHYVGLSPLLDAPPGSLRSYVRALLGLTPTGVDLFFVLSGFLIGGILLDHRSSPQLLRAFYLRRFLRIVPVAWLAIGLSIALRYLAGDHSTPAIPWWVGLTFTANFFMAAANGWVLSPLTAHWSLAIEEQFYLFFPWVVRAWPRRSLAWLGPVLILGSLAARILVSGLAPEFQFACSVLTFCRLDALGTGFVAAWLVRSVLWPAIRENRRQLWFMLLVCSAGLAILLKQQYRTPAMMTTWGYTIVALFYGVALLLVYEPRERWLGALFSAGWLRLYGKFSYFIYLFQVMLARPLVTLLFHGRWQDTPLVSWWETAAALTVMLAPAALSWHLLEAPLLRVGRGWAYD
jgi:peptidoglycan/LPS O-acetylase OafA/YrhL